MNLTRLSKEVYENALEKGWWEKERELPEIIALCHSELSEALEEYRNKKPNYYFIGEDGKMHRHPIGLDFVKPEGVAVELADCIIRILDYCGKERINIERIVKAKVEYNKTRPYRHGGKLA